MERIIKIVKIRKSFAKPFTTVILLKQTIHPAQVSEILDIITRPINKTGIIIINQIFKKLNGNNAMRNMEPIR